MFVKGPPLVQTSTARTDRPQWLNADDLRDIPVIGLRTVVADQPVDAPETIYPLYPLPSQRQFSLGSSPDCLIVIPDSKVSRIHCMFERRADGSVHVRDAQSKNGTWVNGVRIDGWAWLGDGCALKVGRTTLVAFAEEHRARHGRDEVFVGKNLRFRAAVEGAIESVANGRGVIVQAEHGAGRTALARAIHEVLVGPQRPLAQYRCIEDRLQHHHYRAVEFKVPKLETLLHEARGGIAYVHEISAMSPDARSRMVDSLLRGSDDRALRFVVSTARNLPPMLFPDDVSVVHVPPLRDRGRDLVLLIDHFVRRFLGPGRSHADLPPDVVQALAAYDWPKNVHELHDTMERICALIRDKSFVAAAASLQLARSSIQAWMANRGIPTENLIRHA